MQTSWYGRNVAVPVHNSNDIAKDRNTKQLEARGSYNGNEPHRTASSIVDTRATNSSNVYTNHFLPKNVGKVYKNPYIGSVPSKVCNQSAVAAPTKIIRCDRDMPMSQLTSSFDSRGNGSHYSHGDSSRQQIPTRVQNGPPSPKCGIHPFNMNRSATSDHSTFTSNSSKTRENSEWNSLQSSMSQRAASNAHLLHRNVALMQNPTQHSHASTQHVNNIASLYSQDTSQTSGYISHCISQDSSQSGIPRFQTKNHGLSQSSRTSSNSHSEGAPVSRDSHLNYLIGKMLNDHLHPKMKEFDDRQLSFSRRISAAEDKHVEYMKVFDDRTLTYDRHVSDTKNNHVEELKKRSTKIDSQLIQVTKKIIDCTEAMERQALENHQKGLYVETMYNKVAGMLKSIESSAVTLKEIAANSISALKQTRESVVESVLPILKQKATEIVSSLVSGFTLSVNSSQKVSTMNNITESDSSVDDDHGKTGIAPITGGTLSDLRLSKRRCSTTNQAPSLKNFDSSSKCKTHSISKVNYGAHKNLTPTSNVASCVVGTVKPTSQIPDVIKPLRISKVNNRSRNKTSTEKTLSIGKAINPAKHCKAMSFYPTSQPHDQIYNSTPQPSKVVSPFASAASKPTDNTKFYTQLSPLPPALSARPCETPLRAVSTNGACPRLGKAQSPSRKRRIQEKTTFAKRARSRYGRVRNVIIDDDEMEFSFVSN